MAYLNQIVAVKIFYRILEFITKTNKNEAMMHQREKTSSYYFTHKLKRCV
jgi:hypothetical protein